MPADIEKGEDFHKFKYPVDPDVTQAANPSGGCSLESGSATSTSGISDTQYSSPNHAFQEGGLRAWLTVFGAFVALFVTFGQMNSFGSFLSWYSEHELQHMPPSAISWIGSIQLWVFFVSGGPIGRAFDAFGPSVIMIAGTVIHVSSVMMTSLSTQYYQYILCQGVLFGLGVGMMFYPCLASVSSHFRQYRATALGLAAAGSSLGGVIYPIMFRHLFQQIGFGWAVRISGLVSAVGCLVATVNVTSRVPTRRREYSLVDATGMFRDPRFTLLATGSGFVALGIFIPFFYIVDYARAHSISPNTSFYVLAAMNMGGILGRIAPAWLSDAVGRFNLLMPSAFLSGLSCLVFWLFAKSLVPIMLFAVTYGFFSGAFISVITPCVAQISDTREIGTRIGMLYSIISVPSLLGGPAGGALLTWGHGCYTGLIVFSGTTVVVGSLFILLAKLKVDSRVLARV